MNTIILAHLFLGPLLLVVALMLKFFPPKEINSFFGYRTPRSMKTKEIWDEANRFSANMLIRLSLAVIGVQIFSIFTFQNDESLGYTISTIAFVLAPILLIFVTEKHLKNNFDRNGKPIAH